MAYTPDFSSRFRIIKGGKISLVVSALIAGSTMSYAAPSGGSVTSGTAAISQNGSVTTINQSTQNASINWNSFSIAPSETINFVQPSAQSVTLNRVVGTTQSLIEGAMNANGQVFLLNPNGVLFSKDATVNVGGLVASTLNITDANFQAGNYVFEGNSQNSIINMGTITAANGGYVAMMGKTVQNSGTIVATMGNVQMAGGEKISLNLNGNSLVKLTIDEGTLNALVENKGIIKADGGQVYLTTQALNTILDGMVNNTGIIEADSLDRVNGKVVLYAHGGTTNVGGEIKAEGGFIETSGEVLHVSDTTSIKAKTWLLDPTNITIESSGSTTDLTDSSIKASFIKSTLNSGTGVTLQATNDITVNEALDWSQSILTLNAGNNININTQMDLTSTAGLALQYAQTNASGTYNVHAPINIASTGSFSTKSGSNTAINYTIIDSLGNAGSTTGTDLQGINGNLSGNYVLGSNIDASSTSSWNSNAGWKPIGNSSAPFTGSFNGLGHVIDKLTINNSSDTAIGLFGYISGSSSIQNIGLTNVNISSSAQLTFVGGLVGYNLGLLQNDYIGSGTIRSTGYRSNAGGLVGSNKGTIQNSYVNVALSISGGLNFSGMLAAINDSGTIQHCYTMGTMTGGTYGGWITGYNNAIIQYNYTSGDNRYLVGMNSGSGVSNNTSFSNTTRYSLTTYANLDLADAMDTSNTTSAWVIYDGYTYPLLRSFMTPLAVTITNANPTKTYDAQAYTTAVTATYASTPNANLLGTLGYYDSSNQNAINAGTYAVGGLYSNQQGYLISYTNDSTLTIAPKEITVSGITAANKVYDGSTAVTLNTTNMNFDGKINGDELSITAVHGTFDDPNAGNGKTVTLDSVTFGGNDAANYMLSNSLFSTTANITKANATVTANSDTKTYNGTAQSVSGFSATGLVNNETISVLTGVSGATASGTNAGTYNTALTGTDTNYNLTFVNGSLVIDKANATVTANSDTKTYNGQAQSISGFSASGLVNGETESVLSGVSTSGGSGTNAGEYTLSASGTDGNYNLTFVDGKLTIVGMPTPSPSTPSAPKQEKVSNIVTTIVNSTTYPPPAPKVISPLAPQPQQAQNQAQNNTLLQTILPPQGSTNGGTYNLVGTTDGVNASQTVGMDELQAAAAPHGISEIRVPLGQDSIVELVNGGIHLPQGISQELYVVDNSQATN